MLNKEDSYLIEDSALGVSTACRHLDEGGSVDTSPLFPSGVAVSGFEQAVKIENITHSIDCRTI